MSGSSSSSPHDDGGTRRTAGVGQQQSGVTANNEQQGGIADTIAGAIASLDSAFTSEGESAIDRYAYRTFAERFRDERDRFHDYREVVNQARLDETYDRYLARVAFWTCVAAVTGALVGVTVAIVLLQTGVLEGISISIGVDVPFSVNYPGWLIDIWGLIAQPLGIALVAAIAGLLAAAPVAGGLYYLPYLAAYERERSIDVLLPQAVTFMYALSQGDMTFPQIVRELAEQKDSYGEVAESFAAVVNHMDYFGADLRTALRETRDNTPSEELASLMDDMISIIDSGGEIKPFLAGQVDKYQGRAEDRADQELDTLEFIAEMYVTVGVVGLLLGVVVLVIIASISGGGFTPLYGLIYGAIPLVSVMFAVVIGTIAADDTDTRATVKTSDERVPTEAIEARLNGEGAPIGRDPGAGAYGHPDEPGAQRPASPSGKPAPDGGVAEGEQGGLLARDESALSALLTRRERRETIETLTRPFARMREQPLLTLAVTVPFSVVWVAAAVLTGLVSLSPDGFIRYYKWSTLVVFVAPVAFTLLPMSYFHERNVRYQRQINSELPSALQKLSAANRTGMTLMDSIGLVAENSESELATELERAGRELRFNVNLNEALHRMANRVKNPRLTRVVSLMTQASTASGNVREVLDVAGRDVKKAHEIDRQRFQRLVLYVTIIMFGSAIFMVVAWQLNVRLIPALAEAAEASAGTDAGGSSGPFGSTFNPNELKMLLYHGALALALFSGFVAGKLSTGSLVGGAKYAAAQVLLAAGVFVLI
jgi:flagellar protein FlaJ